MSKHYDEDFCNYFRSKPCKLVIFNRGFTEPKVSASICQGFRGWSVKNKKT